MLFHSRICLRKFRPEIVAICLGLNVLMLYISLYINQMAARLFTVTVVIAFCNNNTSILSIEATVYPKKYAHGFVVLCFVVVMQWFIMNSHEVFIHIHQGCFAGTGEIARLPQCQWSKPGGYGKMVNV